MARFLTVGGEPNAIALADALQREGHVVSAGTHADRGALAHVAIVCWLEGSSPERFLLRAVDSSMRGFVYQAAGKERSVLETAARNSIPVAILTADPNDLDTWLAQALGEIGLILEGRTIGLDGS